MITPSLPLISCIMPTNNRRAFVSHAIQYFLLQDYANKELLIVDDGTDSIEDLVPQHEEIRYIRLQRKMTLGEKRNYCVKESKGDLIMHWDDDDWMAPYRISYQVDELLKNHTEVCGLQQMYFREMNSGKCWLYKYPPNAQPWLAGGSLLYTRGFWQQSPFPDMQVASDTRFIFSRKLTSYSVLADCNFYVASIHGNNTSTRQTKSSLWHPVDASVIKKIIDNSSNDYNNSDRVAPREKPKQNGVATSQLTKVSACLLSYKRPANMQLIVDILHHLEYIDEILVWDNHPSKKLVLKGNKVRIIPSTENKICYGRFLCAMQAKNELIYVQDDDALVNNVTTLYHAFLHDGKGITHALQQDHLKILNDYCHFYGQGALLGWGAFFKKSWLKNLERFVKDFSEDHLLRREADQIFSILLRAKHTTLPASIQMLDDNSTKGIALYLEPEHNVYKALAASKALSFSRRLMNHIYPVTWNIVIPCKNYGNYLKEAVESVLSNTGDYIITIVDDGSTDNTEQTAQALVAKYSFIHYIKLTDSKGVSYARNAGIASVESLFVVLLDADDKIGNRYLLEAERLLRSGYDVANPDAILFGAISTVWRVPDTVTLTMQLAKNHVHTSSAFRRSYWVQTGGIDETMHNWQDYEFWIRLAAAGARIRRLPGNHFYYRKHGPSKSTESALKSDAVKSYIRSKHTSLYNAVAL
jgi:glycosyltransferase involved in cell wall biosynthesis